MGYNIGLHGGSKPTYITKKTDFFAKEILE